MQGQGRLSACSTSGAVGETSAWVFHVAHQGSGRRGMAYACHIARLSPSPPAPPHSRITSYDLTLSMQAHFMILRGRCQHDFIYLMHIKRAAKHADMATGLLHHTHVHIRRSRARAGLSKPSPASRTCYCLMRLRYDACGCLAGLWAAAGDRCGADHAHACQPLPAQVQ